MRATPLPGIFLCLCAIAAMGAAAAAQGRPAAVLVDFVDERSVSETTPVIGRLVASIESAVAARTDGVVEQTLFQVGDGVTSGQELVLLDDELHRIERRAAASAVSEAEAGASMAVARMRLAEQALERATRLRGSTAFNQGNLDDLEQRLAEAQAERARASATLETRRANLAEAEYALERTRIIAPFDGVVVDKAAHPGQYITTGEPVVTLLDLNALEIEADVPSDIVGGMTPGTVVAIAFELGEDGEATVRATVPRASVSTRTRPVRFSLDLSTIDPSRLAVGEAVTLFAPSGAPRSVVTAPKDALVHSGAGWIVYLVQDGVATPRPVAIGAPAGERVEVRSGLQPGDMVVVRGNERLLPGQPVDPTPVDGATASTPAPVEG